MEESISNGAACNRIAEPLGSRCTLTGITDPALLRVSHIAPWSDCNHEQRPDVTTASSWRLLAVADRFG
jgi:hypothetical protein